MADVYIPFEIQAEIMKRLPVKSLIRFTSVSKTWKSFIRSSEFIHDHQLMQSQHHLLLGYYVRSDKLRNKDDKYMSIADDDTFPLHKTCMNIPMSVDLLYNPRIVVGSSGGLFCIYNFSGNINDLSNAMVWNPTIKKYIAIDVPNMLQTESYHTIVGFGVSPRTSDLMLVKITFDTRIRKQVEYPTSPSQVEVFTLSLGYWRSPRSNLPRKSITFSYKQVVIDEFIYWRAYHNFCGDGEYNLVMSFNMISEEFTELNFPESLASSMDILSLSKLRESLAVVENNPMSNVTIWILQNCDPKSFTKLFTFNAPNLSGGDVFVFRPSGELIIMKNKYSKEDELFVYESNSQEVNYFWISGKLYMVYVTPYIETLLLLDHKDNRNISKSGADKRRGLNWASKVWRSMKSFIY